MFYRIFQLRILQISLIFLILPFSIVHGQPTFTIIDIGANRSPAAINNSNHVIGLCPWTNPSGQQHTVSFEWVYKGSFNVVYDGVSQAFDINNNNTIVGNIIDSYGVVRAFISHLSGSSRKFSLFDPDPITDPNRYRTEARSINDHGFIVGFKKENRWDLPQGPTLWYSESEYTFIKGMDRPQYAIAQKINNSNQVIINYSYPSNESHALIYETSYPNPTAKFLSHLSYVAKTYCFSINDYGVIVGKSKSDEDKYHAVMWRSEKIIDLGKFGGIEAEARSINNNEQIVGTITLESGAQHPFLWQNGLVLDLNDANIVGNNATGWSLKSAVDINDNGCIVGEGFLNFEAHGFLLIPGDVTNISDDRIQLTSSFELHQNYPNPFNSSTVISYTLSTKADVKLEVYNSLGQWLRTLQNQSQSEGYHKIIWNGYDSQANIVESGIYFLKLTVGKSSLVKKMIFLE